MAYPPLRIDPSNRRDHHYLGPQDECYYFFDYSARQGHAHSAGNDLIANLKKPVARRGMPEYLYKELAISTAGAILGETLRAASWVFAHATIVPIPPSHARGEDGYDDRVMRIASVACAGQPADLRELIVQADSYPASHRQDAGQRLRPDQLLALYRLAGPAPRPILILVDDVITSGAHFVACQRLVLRAYPGTRVFGFFIARRAMPDLARQEV